jgi:hypothetical protein
MKHNQYAWLPVPFVTDIPRIIADSHISKVDDIHDGRYRMMYHLMRTWFLTGVQVFIDEFIDQCDKCAEWGPSPPAKPVQPIYSKLPLERIVIDTSLWFGFHICLVVCHFTKYIWGEVFERKYAGPIARWFLKCFGVEGTAGMYHSDNGTEVNNDVMSAVNKELGTEREVSSQPYNPRCQGAIEIRNKTVKRKAGQHIKGKKNITLQGARRALEVVLLHENDQPTQMYGVTPFFALRGRDRIQTAPACDPAVMAELWVWMRQRQREQGERMRKYSISGSYKLLDVGVYVRVRASPKQIKTGTYNHVYLIYMFELICALK